jgi:hypothetical protein
MNAVLRNFGGVKIEKGKKMPKSLKSFLKSVIGEEKAKLSDGRLLNLY